ncbi:sulfate ABC transporter substrate-binding protein [Aureimonas populi]|uniref:Sulfate ABC transporter substrate-binding protein n=1 Tax=Aureimonas populi TaxID=1701758 RepID=A0ABW5CSA8_9HYPH|nr:sulfate ABC transporter substrate-binding protein [Aureimonas populi]
MIRQSASAAFLAAAVLWAIPASSQTLLNVSYDPTRELYREFNAAFSAHRQAEGHERVTVRQSHGGSGAQARTVIDGIDADVVTLALEADINAIVEATGKIPENWRTLLPHNSSPYTSTIVFLVRTGNPKGIEDWDDLIRDDVEVITPNPKSSGGARWNYLAAWAYANKAFGNDQEKTREFVRDIYLNVPVLDTAARGATTTFVQRGIGDVLLAWENEAFLAIEELGPDQFEIIVPSVSILAEPPVAVVQANAEAKGTADLARAYLEYLYSPEGQTIAARHYYRPASPELVTDPAELERFPAVELVTIDDEQFGGWARAQPEHFGEGGIFDQIYVPAN